MRDEIKVQRWVTQTRGTSCDLCGGKVLDHDAGSLSHVAGHGASDDDPPRLEADFCGACMRLFVLRALEKLFVFKPVYQDSFGPAEDPGLCPP